MERRPTILTVMPAWGGVGLHAVFGHRMPPLACLTLAALARRQGWAARVVDCNFDPLPAGRPDLVAITVWTALAPEAYRIADAYRSRGVPVVLGGVHASLLPTEALRHADAVVVGEAEPVMATVLADALAGRLRGVYEGAWGAMDGVPTAREWMDLLDGAPRYRYIPRNVLQATRGCRFNCDYCSVIRINGRGSRHLDPAVVVEELRLFERHGQRFGPFRYVAFQDDDFAADPAYAESLCRAIVKSGVRVAWSTQASIGIAGDPAFVALLARAGCRAVFTGLESVSRAALVEANKKNRPPTFERAIRRLHDQRIVVEGGFIFGFDDDRPGVFTRTAAAAHELELDAAHFALLTPYPGTHTFARMATEGRITTYDWGLYDLYHAVIDHAHMSKATLEAGLRDAYRAFYGRGARTARWLRQVRARLHPAMGTAILLGNAGYARHYVDFTPDRPSHEPDAGDIRRLLQTSLAPAEQALSSALAQVPVSLGPARAGVTTP